MKTIKYQEIIDSYLNGNISWVKSQVIKLTKKERKELYVYYLDILPDRKDSIFFFSLI